MLYQSILNAKLTQRKKLGRKMCTSNRDDRKLYCTDRKTRQLRQFRVSPAILKTFYSGAIESVLTQCISVWYGNVSDQDCKALQRVVCLAEHISGSALPSLQDIYLKRCKSRAVKIIKDSNHPCNGLFILLPAGKHDGKN